MMYTYYCTVIVYVNCYPNFEFESNVTSYMYVLDNLLINQKYLTKTSSEWVPLWTFRLKKTRLGSLIRSSSPQLRLTLKDDTCIFSLIYILLLTLLNTYPYLGNINQPNIIFLIIHKINNIHTTFFNKYII